MIVGGFARICTAITRWKRAHDKNAGSTWEVMSSLALAEQLLCMKKAARKREQLQGEAVGSWNYRADGHCALHASKLAVCCQQ